MASDREDGESPEEYRVRLIRESQRMEQQQELLFDSVVSSWWRIYQKCVEKGFTADQALKILRTFIRSGKKE